MGLMTMGALSAFPLTGLGRDNFDTSSKKLFFKPKFLNGILLGEVKVQPAHRRECFLTASGMQFKLRKERLLKILG